MWERHNHDGRSKEEVFQDAASKTAHELYSSSCFAAADGKFRMSLQEDILRTTNIRFRGTHDKVDLDEILCGGDGRVTTIDEACCLLRGGGGEPNNVPSNKNFIRNSSKRNYRNKLAYTPIDITAVLARASVTFGVTSPTTRMVDQACVHVLRMLFLKEKDQPMTSRMKKRLCCVRVNLAEKRDTC
jgi:hypothetical protein